MQCLVCLKEEAIRDPILGILPGKNCQKRRAKNILPDPVEMVGESIKNERQIYTKSTVQPFNSAGVFSDEYYQAHGTKGVKVNADQLKNRRRIWDKAISQNMDIKKTK